MPIINDINNDLVQSQKNKQADTVSVLRQVKTALQNAEISNNRQELTDEQVVKLLRTEIKRRKESIDMYNQGNRPELAQKEQFEIDILQRYVPLQASEDTIRAEVKKVIESTGASSMQDMGEVMGETMKALGGNADGSVVSRIVKEELAS